MTTLGIQTITDSFVGDDVTTDFNFTFMAFYETEVYVAVDDVVKTLTADYTISGLGEYGGGTVSFVTAPLSGEIIDIYWTINGIRYNDFSQVSRFNADNVNNEFNRLWMAFQQRERTYPTMQTVYNSSVVLNVAEIALGANDQFLIDVNETGSSFKIVMGATELVDHSINGTVFFVNDASGFLEVYDAQNLRDLLYIDQSGVDLYAPTVTAGNLSLAAASKMTTAGSYVKFAKGIVFDNATDGLFSTSGATANFDFGDWTGAAYYRFNASSGNVTIKGADFNLNLTGSVNLSPDTHITNNFGDFDLAGAGTYIYKVNGVQVLGVGKTGWGVPTGTLSRATFDSTTITHADLAQVVAALITDLHLDSSGHGILKLTA